MTVLRLIRWRAGFGSGKSPFFCLLLFALISPSPAFADDPPPGGMRLLEGYQHRRIRTVDTDGGEIFKPGDLTIRYMIGELAGAVVNQYRLKDRKWIKREFIDDRPVYVMLTNEDKMVVTFAKTAKERATANFWATVKSPQDIAEFLLMTLSYKQANRPANSVSATQPNFTLEPIDASFDGIRISIDWDQKVHASVAAKEEHAGQTYVGQLSPGEKDQLARLLDHWFELDSEYGWDRDATIERLDYGVIRVYVWARAEPKPFAEARSALLDIAGRVIKAGVKARY